VLIAMGSIHPESGWYFEEPLEISFPDGTWTVIVRDSQFHVLINGEPPEDVATFRNEVASVVQGFLDSLGFLLAIPLQAEVRSILIGGDPVQLALYRQSWPDLLEDPQSPPQVKAADLELFNVATVEVLEARAALADLRAALQYPNDTGFYAYRAVESVRQWFVEDDKADKGTAKARSWTAMREALGLDSGQMNRLKQLAAARRHGAVAPPTEAERLEALRIARPAVKAFVDYLTAQRPAEETIGPAE
jgi:hypothetical protein